MSLVFDKELCVGCGRCVHDCVCGILALMDDGFPAVREGQSERCVHCGHCSAVCPTGAVVLDGRPPALCQAAEEGFGLQKHLDAFLKGRRAIRQYTGNSVSRALVEKAVEYAAYAPTAHNSRQVSYIVMNGRDKVEAFLASTVRLLEKAGMYAGHVAHVKQGQDTLFRGAPCLILIHAPVRPLSEADCATAAAYLELALHGLGLGSCWAGMLVEACARDLPEGLVLPEGHTLYAALMVGNSNISYPRIPYRSAPAVVWQ